MKKLILAATLTVASLSANASDKDEYCNLIYGYAETIMNARQNGLPMPKMRQIVKNTNDDALISIGNSLIDWAYSQPKYHSKELQKHSTNRFAERAYYGCKEVERDRKKKGA